MIEYKSGDNHVTARTRVPKTAQFRKLSERLATEDQLMNAAVRAVGDCLTGLNPPAAFVPNDHYLTVLDAAGLTERWQAAFPEIETARGMFALAAWLWFFDDKPTIWRGTRTTKGGDRGTWSYAAADTFRKMAAANASPAATAAVAEESKTLGLNTCVLWTRQGRNGRIIGGPQPHKDAPAIPAYYVRFAPEFSTDPRQQESWVRAFTDRSLDTPTLISDDERNCLGIPTTTEPIEPPQ
jgi:hypothetical protein